MPRQHHLPNPRLCILISSLSRVRHIHISLRFTHTHTHTYRTAARRASRLCRSQSSMKTSRSSCHRYAPQATAATCLLQKQRAPLARLLQRVISSYWPDLTKGSGMAVVNRRGISAFIEPPYIYESYFRTSLPRSRSKRAELLNAYPGLLFTISFPARDLPDAGGGERKA